MSASSGPPSTGNARVDRMLHGMMGAAYLTKAELEGPAVDLHFRQDDRYFVNDEFIARLIIGAAFGLLYRCGLNEARFHFLRDGQEVRLRVAKSAFNVFFRLSEAQMERLTQDPERFDASPVHRVSEARQWEFYLQFAKEA